MDGAVNAGSENPDVEAGGLKVGGLKVGGAKVLLLGSIKLFIEVGLGADVCR